MSVYRTHTCNEIRLENVGEEVKLSGFVKTIRDLGGCVFIDLRDHYGVTQLTTEKTEAFSPANAKIQNCITKKIIFLIIFSIQSSTEIARSFPFSPFRL